MLHLISGHLAGLSAAQIARGLPGPGLRTKNAVVGKIYRLRHAGLLRHPEAPTEIVERQPPKPEEPKVNWGDSQCATPGCGNIRVINRRGLCQQCDQNWIRNNVKRTAPAGQIIDVPGRGW